MLEAFTASEYELAKEILAERVMSMGGRKLEEADWADVYHRAKGLPDHGWSNLRIDVIHEGLGVEHKMLCTSGRSVADLYGKTLMHPAATRAIRVPPTDVDPDEAMREVLDQYAAVIRAHRDAVALTGTPAELRFGWLLWKRDLSEFLYFEQEMLEPDPDDYYARWNEIKRTGSRKGSRNLWIFERETDVKRYSVTTSAGAKVQPYFDVPVGGKDPVYEFAIQGERLPGARRRTWVKSTTAQALESALGGLDPEILTKGVLELAERQAIGERAADPPSVDQVVMSDEAYEALRSAFEGSSDDERLLDMLDRQAAADDG